MFMHLKIGHSHNAYRANLCIAVFISEVGTAILEVKIEILASVRAEVVGGDH